MNRKELYYKTVDILLDAYNNEELFHGNCDACAVGNIVKANGGFGQKPACSKYSSNWGIVFCTSMAPWVQKQIFNPENYGGEAKQELDQTGYHIEELAKIEYAFEFSISHLPVPQNTSLKDSYNYYKDVDVKKGQFIGLTAVLEVLASIHEIDKQGQESSQEKLQTVYNKFQKVTH